MKKVREIYSISVWGKENPKTEWKNYFTVKELNAFEKKRSLGSLVVRYLLKKILITQGIANDFLSIEIMNEKSGKPSLDVDGQKQAHIHFSLSHSKTDVAVLVVIE